MEKGNFVFKTVPYRLACSGNYYQLMIGLCLIWLFTLSINIAALP